MLADTIKRAGMTLSYYNPRPLEVFDSTIIDNEPYFVFKPQLAEQMEKEIKAAEETLSALAPFIRGDLSDIREMVPVLLEENLATTSSHKDKCNSILEILNEMAPFSWRSPLGKLISALEELGLNKGNMFKEDINRVIAGAIACSEGYGHALREWSLLSAKEVNRSRYLERLSRAVTNISERYDWHRMLDVNLDCETDTEICVKRDANSRVSVSYSINKNDMDSLVDSGLSFEGLRYNSKKVLVGGLEKVSKEEVNKAVRKISTVVGDQDIIAFKVTKGLRILRERDLLDFWGVQRRNDEELAGFSEDIGNSAYIVRIKTEDKTFITMGSSLGRALSSCSKQLQNAVMDSLDLDQLSF